MSETNAQLHNVAQLHEGRIIIHDGHAHGMIELAKMLHATYGGLLFIPATRQDVERIPTDDMMLAFLTTKATPSCGAMPSCGTMSSCGADAEIKSGPVWVALLPNGEDVINKLYTTFAQHCADRRREVDASSKEAMAVLVRAIKETFAPDLDHIRAMRIPSTATTPHRPEEGHISVYRLAAGRMEPYTITKDALQDIIQEFGGILLWPVSTKTLHLSMHTPITNSTGQLRMCWLPCVDVPLSILPDFNIFIPTGTAASGCYVAMRKYHLKPSDYDFSKLLEACKSKFDPVFLAIENAWHN